MNQDPSTCWPAMMSNPEEDFANFLEFEDLNFSAFSDTVPSTQNAGDGSRQQDGEIQISNPQETPTALLEFDGQEHTPHTMGPQSLMHPYDDNFHASVTVYEQQRSTATGLQNQRWQLPNMVPPTPNSIEMHAGHMQNYGGGIDQQLLQQQHMYEQLRRQQKDQMNFTPLISPAVTPLDTQFRFIDPSLEPFSPLTSPALQAQNQLSHNAVYHAVQNSDTSNTTSPVDYSLEYSAPTSNSSSVSVRKSRRKPSTSSVKNTPRLPKRSPAMKPQSKKKQPSSTVIHPGRIADVIEQANQRPEPGVPVLADPKSSLAYHQGSSGPDSVSPEPLSDILMPPPATPRSNSAGRSPHLSGQQDDQHSKLDQGGEPATPASLMRIRKQNGKSKAQGHSKSQMKKQVRLAESDMEQIMEDIVLPEATVTPNNNKFVPTNIDTAQANNETLARGKAVERTVRGPPNSAPNTATGSSFPSPSASAIASPTAAGSERPGDVRPKGRDSKKRSSMSNDKASPALRPRISPSIKPLLPEGATVSPETSALMLASKSNYQNILEGTHFPGVSYPENLSTNLTSKRTSHKIAEQGRRNRINTALHEIAALLPPTTPQTLPNGKVTNGMGEGERAAAMTTGSAQQQNNSKASTVEAAIDYIKTLQKEVKDCREKIAEYELKDAQAIESDGSSNVSMTDGPDVSAETSSAGE